MQLSKERSPGTDRIRNERLVSLVPNDADFMTIGAGTSTTLTSSFLGFFFLAGLGGS